jgi:penicillin amidase
MRVVFLMLAACTGEAPNAERPATTPEGWAPTIEEDTCSYADIALPDTYTPSAGVEVRRDAQNIPHVYAQTDADAFWAQGYLHATDRLYQIDIARRAAVGRLAEVRGESAELSDKQAFAFGFSRYACHALRDMAAARPEDYALMVAYGAGLNARVSEVLAGDAPKPAGYEDLQPEPFTMLDLMAHGRRVAFGYSNSLDFDLLYSIHLRLVEDAEIYPVGRAAGDAFIMGAPMETSAASAPSAFDTRPMPALEADEEAELVAHLAALRGQKNGMGSNNWAVNGRYTADGRPLLANDPHATLNDPSSVYMIHLDSASAGGNFDVAGFGFVGVPAVHLGHNRDIAWAATTNYADVMDLWDVPVASDMSTAELGGVEVPVTRYDDTYRVKVDGGFEERVYSTYAIPGYGVFLDSDLLGIPTELLADGGLLVNWNGFRGITDWFEYVDLDRAEDLDDFEAAVLNQTTGLHNWVGASADGWRYRVHGEVPDRGAAASRVRANRVLDGTDASTFWTGATLPDDALPRLDGSQAFIQTANQDPWGHSADGDPTNDSFYYGGFYDPGFRGQRAHDELLRLTAGGGLTWEDMAALQLDTTSPVAERMIPILEDAWAAVGTDDTLETFEGREDLAAAVATLSAWDRRMVRTSSEAALFRAFEAFLGDRTYASALGLLFEPIESASPVTVASMTIQAYELGLETILDGRGRHHVLTALDQALDWVEERRTALGLESVVYSDVHDTTFGAPDESSKTVEVDGDNATLNVSECHFFSEGDPVESCVSGAGPVFRQVTSFDADGTPVWHYTWPYGQDGDVTHWIEGEYRVLPFERADVEAATVSVETIGG